MTSPANAPASPQTTPHVSTVRALRETVATWRRAGETVALVPTMGALHGGHLDLVRLAHSKAKRAIVSIFVNPAQFAPHEDLDRYPRTFEADLAALATVGCDLVWAPTAKEMYPDGFATRIAPLGAAEGLETDFRPHFFGGVTTVCAKLFLQVAPDFVVFGEKDYQQLAVIRQLVRDLDMPIEVVGAVTSREADGLAMSSRNRYLSPEERVIAPVVHRTLQGLASRIRAAGAGFGPQEADLWGAEAAKQLIEAGFAKIDYIVVRDAVTLKPLTGPSRGPLRVLAAAWLGRTRLIDNIGV